MRFETLYHFSYGPLHLLETKRLDLPLSATPGEIYQWILVEDNEIHLLHFESMTLKPQRRVFREGMIEFDLNSCHGRLNNKDLELVRQDSMSDKLKKLAEQGLKTK